MSIFDVLWKESPDTRKSEAEEKAKELYQVQEYQGEIWLTFDGRLVCPASMLKDSPVDALKTMRALYIERNA